MGNSFAGIASNGPLLLAMSVAALAGLVSFLSPCILPLVPGYLSYVTGLAGSDLDDALNRPTAAARGRLALGVFGFIAGFTAVFTLMGIFAASVGRLLLGNEPGRQLGQNWPGFAKTNESGRSDGSSRACRNKQDADNQNVGSRNGWILSVAMMTENIRPQRFSAR